MNFDLTRRLKKNAWLIITLILALLPLAVVKYFFTNDGPCHMYNAHVLFDIWLGGADFYRQFYEVSNRIDPNITDHLVLGFLQLFLEPYMAEKLFQMAYVALLVVASYKLITFFNKKSGILVLCILPIVYPWSFAEGFYNYSFSLALMIYAMYFFCAYGAQRTAYNWLRITVILIILYFCHPVGLALALIAFGLVMLIYTYGNTGIWTQPERLTGNILSDIAAVSIPVLLFLLKLFFNPNKTDLKIDYKPEYWTHFFENEGMVVMGEVERPYTRALAIIMLGIGAVLLLYRLIQKDFKAYHFLLVMAVVALAAFLLFPDAAMGGWMLKPRLRYLPYVFLTLWICIAGRGYLAPLIAVAYLVPYLQLMNIRIPLYAIGSARFEAQEKALGMIENETVVLPINFNKNSVNADGSMLQSVHAMHYHAFQYAGCKGQKIVCDNYEAIMDYFPLKWLPAMNTYNHMGPYAAVEWTPNEIDIVNYERVSGKKVDYVIYANDYTITGVPQVKHQIDTLFDIAYEDKAAFITLYKRNNRPSHQP
jgi:hypothetical protein